MWTSQKAPKGAGELIVYLDFDGVLHHENCLWHPKRGPYLKAPPGYVLFAHAPLLEALLTVAFLPSDRTICSPNIRGTLHHSSWQQSKPA